MPDGSDAEYLAYVGGGHPPCDVWRICSAATVTRPMTWCKRP
jgi:hypothetical protein